MSDDDILFTRQDVEAMLTCAPTNCQYEERCLRLLLKVKNQLIASGQWTINNNLNDLTNDIDSMNVDMSSCGSWEVVRIQ